MARASGEVAEERPELLIFCSVVAAIGAVAPIVLLLMGASVAEHDLVADTISDLARGPHKWIMDLGFYLGAAGLLALSIAAAHLHLGRADWSAGIIILALTALVVVLLGLWDKFGGSDMSVHTKLSFALAPLYFLGPLAMVRGAGNISGLYRVAFIAAAALWLVFAVGFKLAPNSYDGLLEKIAFLATMLWTLPLAWLFGRRGRRAMDISAIRDIDGQPAE